MSCNYRPDHIPCNTPCNRRPENKMTATTITIHNTGNPSSTAKNERKWLTNPSNCRTASYHIVIDEHEAIECVPLCENAWHAGDGNGDGNRKSIGIEICESGNYAKTLDNAANLVAKTLKERGWGTDKLRRHFDWSGKICPRLMYDGGKWTGWHKFKAEVEKRMKAKDNPMGDNRTKTKDKPGVEKQMKTKDKPMVVKLCVDGKYIGKSYFSGRAFADAIGAETAWDNENKIVDITTKRTG